MNTHPYIGFWKRTVAFVVDLIISAVPPAIICLPLMWWQGNLLQNTPQEEEMFLVRQGIIVLIYLCWQLLGLLSFWLYFALSESSSRQATIGKRLLKIKVIGKDGGRIGFGRATARTFSKILSYVTLYIGFIMAGNTSRKRALHDMIAETYVVRSDFEPTSELPPCPAHTLRLWVLSILMVLLSFGVFIAISLASPANQARLVATRLQRLAQQKDPLTQPLVLDGVTYTRTGAGYRATLGDSFGNTLFLANDETTVCCEPRATSNCDLTGFEACE